MTVMTTGLMTDDNVDDYGQPTSSLRTGTPALHFIGLDLKIFGSRGTMEHTFMECPQISRVSDLLRFQRFLATWGLLSLIGGEGGGRRGLGQKSAFQQFLVLEWNWQLCELLPGSCFIPPVPHERQQGLLLHLHHLIKTKTHPRQTQSGGGGKHTCVATYQLCESKGRIADQLLCVCITVPTTVTA